MSWQLQLAQHKRLEPYGTHPNPSLKLGTFFYAGDVMRNFKENAQRRVNLKNRAGDARLDAP